MTDRKKCGGHDCSHGGKGAGKHEAHTAKRAGEFGRSGEEKEMTFPKGFDAEIKSVSMAGRVREPGGCSNGCSVEDCDVAFEKPDRTMVKICGLRSLEDIDSVNEAAVDFAGFVFAPSRRRVTPEEAYRMKERLCPRIASIGVFVDNPAEDIILLASEGIIEGVQLHGSEDAAYIAKLKERTDCPVIKAVQLGGMSPSEMEKAIDEGEDMEADHLLLDTGKGTGRAFDWRAVTGRRWRRNDRFFLAGGLDPENIEEAIAMLHPWAVDVSGGVEDESGKKSRDKIFDFVRRVKN